MIVWIILCPLFSLFANSLENNYLAYSHSSGDYFYKALLSKSSHVVSLGYDQLSLEDNELDHDFFSLGQKLFLTPQYFLFLVYAALLLQVLLLTKRKLPYCYFLASFSRYSFLAKRTLLI